MASSPLEIYEQAYRFQYEENDIPKACDVYRQIIREFPDSNESGYAAIQLQKIHAQDVSRKLGKHSNALGLAALIIAITGFAGIVILGILTFQGMRYQATEARKTTALLQALGLMHAGRDQDALRLLQDSKNSPSRDFTPFALAADIYIRQGKFDRAREEFETYQKLYGGANNEVQPSSQTSAPQPAGSQEDSADPADTTTEKKREPSGTKLTDKTAVLKYLDSLSENP